MIKFSSPLISLVATLSVLWGIVLLAFHFLVLVGFDSQYVQDIFDWSQIQMVALTIAGALLAFSSAVDKVKPGGSRGQMGFLGKVAGIYFVFLLVIMFFMLLFKNDCLTRNSLGGVTLKAGITILKTKCDKVFALGLGGTFTIFIGQLMKSINSSLYSRSQGHPTNQ